MWKTALAIFGLPTLVVGALMAVHGVDGWFPGLVPTAAAERHDMAVLSPTVLSLHTARPPLCPEKESERMVVILNVRSSAVVTSNGVFAHVGNAPAGADKLGLTFCSVPDAGMSTDGAPLGWVLIHRVWLASKTGKEIDL